MIRTGMISMGLMLAPWSGVASAQNCAAQEDFALALHGGAFDGEEAFEEQIGFLKDLAGQAQMDLQDGASALDVVTESVERMEASGLFNAGRASITNAQGFVENDASIMEGQDLNAGAIGSFTATKSPIRAARLVMEESRHVFMVGERGEAYVRELGAQAAPQDWFTQAAQAEKESEHGTVGAVVLDRCGTLAAGTSTGGYDAKIPGRIGDSPVIGAGTYADNRGAAVSATGHGEWFIRYAAAHSISAQVRAGQTLDQAARVVISDMAGHGGLGAVIALDADGNFAAPYSTTGVLYAYTDESGSVRAGTRPDEE